MMEWLALHGGMAVLVVFFALFLAFAFWAYRPSNRNKLESYGQIPLKESQNGQ